MKEKTCWDCPYWVYAYNMYNEGFYCSKFFKEKDNFGLKQHEKALKLCKKERIKNEN